MDPVTVSLSLGLSILNWIASQEKQEALEAFRNALRGEDEAFKALIAQTRATEIAHAELVSYRIANIRWMLPRLEQTFSRVKAPIAGLGEDLDKLFADRSRREMQDLVKKVLACIPEVDLDSAGSVLSLSMAALVVKGLQAADAAGKVSIPILHGTLGEALGKIPIDGADAWARSIGSASQIPMADAIAAPLLVISLVQLAKNVTSTTKLSTDANRLIEAAAAFHARRSESRSVEISMRRSNEAQQEASYQAFRAAMLADAVYQRKQDLPTEIVERTIAHLRCATQTYLYVVNQDPQSN